MKLQKTTLIVTGIFYALLCVLLAKVGLGGGAIPLFLFGLIFIYGLETILFGNGIDLFGFIFRWKAEDNIRWKWQKIVLTAMGVLAVAILYIISLISPETIAMIGSGLAIACVLGLIGWGVYALLKKLIEVHGVGGTILLLAIGIFVVIWKIVIYVAKDVGESVGRIGGGSKTKVTAKKSGSGGSSPSGKK